MAGEVFVGGPMQNAMTDGRFDQAMRSSITAIIGHLERSGFTVRSAHVAERFGAISDRFTPRMVTRRDFDWMSSASAYIAILPTGADGVPVASSGTCVELGWASALRIPTTILWNAARSDAYGHLIRGLHIVTPIRYADIAACVENPGLLADGLILR